MKVKERKLGREKAWGLAHIDEGIIEIETSLKARRRLNILIHEALHILNPEWSETKVIRQAGRLTKLIWSEHYRRIEKA